MKFVFLEIMKYFKKRLTAHAFPLKVELLHRNRITIHPANHLTVSKSGSGGRDSESVSAYRAPGRKDIII